MLVLSRKIGQQLVLPEHGIIIDVVDVGKTRVRLGVTAPSNITVHRGEIRDRAAATDNAPPASGDSPPEVPAVDGSTNAKPHSPSSADLGPCLALWIAKRTGGRVRGLSVETYQDRIVIRGSARSFYARQLAQAAVQEVFDRCDGLPQRPVEYGIDVADEERPARPSSLRLGGSR